MYYSQFFLTKFLTGGILFPRAVRAVVVAKLVKLGILSFTSLILALRGAVVPKSVILGNSSLTSFILASRIVLVPMLVI